MKRFSLSQLTIAAICASLLASTAYAQVNGTGVSDSSLFDEVIDIPTEPDIGVFESIGGIAGETTQVNLFAGGRIASNVDVNSGTEVNVFGGNVDFNFDIFSAAEANVLGGELQNITGSAGSQINISGGASIESARANELSEINITGGSIGSFFFGAGSAGNISGGNFGFLTAAAGSDVNISGGTFGSLSGSRVLGFSQAGAVELIGGEFQLNGNTITDSTFSFSEGDVLTLSLIHI